MYCHCTGIHCDHDRPCDNTQEHQPSAQYAAMVVTPQISYDFKGLKSKKQVEPKRCTTEDTGNVIGALG